MNFISDTKNKSHSFVGISFLWEGLIQNILCMLSRYKVPNDAVGSNNFRFCIFLSRKYFNFSVPQAVQSITDGIQSAHSLQIYPSAFRLSKNPVGFPQMIHSDIAIVLPHNTFLLISVLTSIPQRRYLQSVAGTLSSAG